MPSVRSNAGAVTTFLLCGCACIVRIVFYVLAPDPYLSFGDTAEYIEVAKRFCSTGQYPFEYLALPTFRAPGFPIYVASVSGCFTLPDSWIAVSLILLDAASCGVGMRIVQRLSSRDSLLRATVFGATYAVYPLFVQQSVTIQSEVLTIFFLMVSFYLFSTSFMGAAPLRGKSSYVSLLAGVFLGCAIATRPSALLFLVFLAAAVLVTTRAARTVPLIGILGAALILVPWSTYASISTGKFVLVNDSFCYSVYRGARRELFDVYAASDKKSFERAAARSEEAVRAAEKGPPRRAWCQATLDILARDPAEQVMLAFTKFWAFYRPWPHSGAHNALVVYGVGSIVSALYLLFLLLLVQRSENVKIRALKWFAALFVLCVGLFHVPHQVSNRYRVPFVDPILLLTTSTFLRIRLRYR